mmetsp:Transcript_48517/g.127792  ORF Transcript_48517/g.127792 Transcript_48517/m.127792 type:complete len:379 (-) Transcript_48517:861-1997(-)
MVVREHLPVQCVREDLVLGCGVRRKLDFRLEEAANLLRGTGVVRLETEGGTRGVGVARCTAARGGGVDFPAVAGRQEPKAMLIRCTCNAGRGACGLLDCLLDVCVPSNVGVRAKEAVRRVPQQRWIDDGLRGARQSGMASSGSGVIAHCHSECAAGSHSRHVDERIVRNGAVALGPKVVVGVRQVLWKSKAIVAFRVVDAPQNSTGCVCPARAHEVGVARVPPVLVQLKNHERSSVRHNSPRRLVKLAQVETSQRLGHMPVRHLRPRRPCRQLLCLELWHPPKVEQVPLVVIVHRVHVVAGPRLVLTHATVPEPHEHVIVRPLVEQHILEPFWGGVELVCNGRVVGVDVCDDATQCLLAAQCIGDGRRVGPQVGVKVA